jgi:hypothetical protein
MGTGTGIGMALLRWLARLPASHFILGGLAAIVLFDAAKLACQPDDTISQQIRLWSDGNGWLRCLVSFIAGGLVVHWFGL